MDYPVLQITQDACDAYHHASSTFDQLNQDYDDQKDAKTLPYIFQKRAEMLRQGTIALVMGVTALDQMIYLYGCRFLHHADLNAHIRNMGFAKKWIVVPELAGAKKVDPADPVILRVRELVAARNAIVHQQTAWITIETNKEELEQMNLDFEWERFRKESARVMETFQLCVEFLK